MDGERRQQTTAAKKKVADMNELINLVTQKAGISQDQAQKAVSTVIGYLKDKMPGPMAGQLDRFAEGGESGTAGMGGAEHKAEEMAGRFGRR